MEIRKQEPPEYGERVLYQELESNLALKNPLINDIISVLDEKGFLDEDDKIWARLCLDEVIVNAIKHGNKECKNKKFTTALYATDKEWAVRVEDEGEGFSPDEVPDVEDEETLGYDHGRGILLMKNYMDEIWYFNNGASVQLMRYKRSKFRKLLDKILVFFKIK
ncbi:ATP-binding protein [Candidatus Uabimicrobium sp. HlEnr_7]|uniref:ATP-binding protein n=1 Tax=Candidatus Uabimicrobium helgolandensis TaxID=3095367 RepID=UPI0035568DC8